MILPGVDWLRRQLTASSGPNGNFLIEDDTQNGPDHVDAHRTTGLVLSPFCKRHFGRHTLYTTASMLRTMELILASRR